MFLDGKISPSLLKKYFKVFLRGYLTRKHPYTIMSINKIDIIEISNRKKGKNNGE